MVTLGERLKRLRKEKGLTQAQLAGTLGLSKSAIIQYENNKREPNFDALIKLEKFFDVSGSYLKGKSNFKKMSEEMFMNDVLNFDDNILDMPDEVKERIVPLMNNFYEIIDCILKLESNTPNRNTLINEQKEMLSNLYTTIDIIKRVYFGAYLPSKEEWESNKPLSELDYYKNREAVFEKYIRDLTEKWKAIFTLRCKSLYEEYVRGFNCVRDNKPHLDVLEEIKEQFIAEDDPYPRFSDKEMK
ncbi:MAG: helix-turn-helix transcriptional regulator [Bacillota bacterium]|nr:helix-turn-helix transcriptional regulator [Bacillota bacterium]